MIFDYKPPMRNYDEIDRALAGHGLKARGGFRPRPEDGVPDPAGGRPAAALILAGNVGPAMWEAFARAPEHSDGAAHPLDRWSRRVLQGLAQELGGAALLPSDGPPYHPFQRWARRAEPLHPSPLGVLIHPVHGLWHAYRGALAFTNPMELPSVEAAPSPCESCAERPCLSACPVDAFGAGGYDVPVCAAHIATPAGEDCLGEGCRARRACPVGRDALYPPEQAGFHMAAFLGARQGEAG